MCIFLLLSALPIFVLTWPQLWFVWCSPWLGTHVEWLFLHCGMTRAFSSDVLGARPVGLGTDIAVVLASGFSSSLSGFLGEFSACTKLFAAAVLLVRKAAHRDPPELLSPIHLHPQWIHITLNPLGCDVVQGCGAVRWQSLGSYAPWSWILPSWGTSGSYKALEETCHDGYRWAIPPGKDFLKIYLLSETSLPAWDSSPVMMFLATFPFVLSVCRKDKRINWIKCPRWKAFVIREEAKSSKKGRNQTYPALKRVQEYHSCYLPEIRLQAHKRNLKSLKGTDSAEFCSCSGKYFPFSLFWNWACDGFQIILWKLELACEPFRINSES